MELDEEEAEIIALPPKKRGRPVLLGQQLDSLVQMYIMKVREAGGAVSGRIVHTHCYTEQQTHAHACALLSNTRGKKISVKMKCK